MGLTIQGNTVSATDKVTVYGNECNAVDMYGYEVWKKQTDEWETLFSSTQSYTASGSMPVSGLKSGDTVTVTATAEFVERNSYMSYDHSSSIMRAQLPASLTYYSYSSIALTVGDGKINFTFTPGTSSFKGEVTAYIPTRLTITEIRRKL